MNVFELFAKISLDTKEYESGLNDAKTKGQKWASGIATGVKVGAAAVAAVGTAAISAGTKFIESAKDVAEYGDHIDKMSQKIGISAEAYQEWDAIMQHSGASIDSLRPAMKTLATQAQKNNEAFQQLGISEEELANLSTEDLFAKVITGLQGMEQGTERTYLASQLLGRGATELGALLNTSAEETQKMRDRVHELGGVMSDEAVKAAAKYQDTLQDLQTSMQGMKRNLMSDFLPGITAVMDGLTEIFLQNTDEGLDTISKGIDDIITKVTEKLPVVLKVVSSILEAIVNAIVENFPKIIETCVNVVLEVANAIIDNLPTIIEAVLQGIITIIKAIGEALPDLIPTIVEAILMIIDTILDNLPLLIEAIIKVIAGLAEGIVKAIPIIIKKLPEIIKSIVEAIIECLPILINGLIDLVFGIVEHIPEIIVALIEAIPDIIVKVAEAVFENFPTIILAVIKGLGLLLVKIGEWFLKLFGLLDEEEEVTSENIGEWFETLFADIGEWLSNIFESIGEFFSSLFESIGNFFKSVWETISNFFSNLFKNIGTWLSSIFKGIGEWFKGLIGKVGDWVKGIFDRIANFFKRAWELGKSLVDGIWKGISDNATAFWNKIKRWLESVWGGIKDFFEIHSPSGKGQWLTKMLLEGFAVGFDKYGNIVIKAAEDINQGIIDAFDTDYQIPISAYGETGLFDSVMPNEYDDEMYIDEFGSDTIVPRAQDIASRDITIILELDGTEFARTVYKANNEETQRVGVRLAGVGA